MQVIKDDYSVFCSILDYGKGSRMLKLSKELGGVGSTIFLGKGTVSVEWLQKLGFTDVRKEVFVTLLDRELEDGFYEAASQRFSLTKPHTGIAFSIPITSFIQGDLKHESPTAQGGDEVSYRCIFVIVDKGISEDVMEAAVEAGATGGTIMHGRGSGTQEKAKLFNIEIEPEKDIVLILSPKDKADIIADAIGERLDIDRPNTGVIFVLDVSRTLGLYEE